MATLTKSDLESKMLRLAGNGRSPQEISAALGGVVSPEKVAATVKTILVSQNWLTDIEQDRILRWKMGTLLETLEKQYQDLDTIKVSLQILKVMGDRFDKRQAATAVDVNTYHQNVGRQLGHVVDLALTYMKGALREDVDAEKWDVLVENALSLAWTEIQKKQIQED